MQPTLEYCGHLNPAERSLNKNMKLNLTKCNVQLAGFASRIQGSLPTEQLKWARKYVGFFKLQSS